MSDEMKGPEFTSLDLSKEDAGQPTAAKRLMEFRTTLSQLTPQIWVTPLLVVANIAIYVLMVVKGVSPLAPTVDSLIHWGANYGPATVNGDWWRLFTAMFLHIGFIHLLCNMWVLTTTGPVVERMTGNIGFLIAYTVCGLAGSFASIYWNPYVVSAGASGALFGMYGVLFGFLIRSRNSIPAEILGEQTKSALLFIGYNLFYGATKSGIDNAAHVGGLVGGLLFGLAMAYPLNTTGARLRLPRAALVGVGSIALIAGAVRAAPHVVDLQAEINKLIQVESAVVDEYNRIIDDAKAQKLNDAEFGDRIERAVLPPWREVELRFSKIHNLPPEQQTLVDAYSTYITERREAWELASKGAKNSDGEAIRKSNEMLERAEKKLKEFAESTRNKRDQ